MSVFTEFLTETLVEGRPLGRHVQHDPASRRYALDTSGLSLTSVRHERYAPILDQGNVGCCTGCAMTGALSCDPFWETAPAGHPTYDITEALKLYSEATQLDSITGAYPPDDTGSTGLAVAQAAQRDGLISGYLHTFTLNDALLALSTTPILIGISWFSSFDTPDANGLVSIAPGANVRGGHELVVDEVVVAGSSITIGFDNSWGASWGDAGRGYMSADTFGTLLNLRGDVVVPVPITAPTPVPAPAPNADDLNLWVQMKAWAKAKGLV